MKKLIIIFLSLISLLLLVGVVCADTLVVYAVSTNADGRMARNTSINETWGVIIKGAGTTIENLTATITMIGTSAQTSATGYYISNVRFGWIGNASASGLPSNAIINSANFSIKGAGTKSNGLGSINAALIGFTPSNNSTINTSDYNKNGTVKYNIADIPYASWNNTGWNNFSLNASGIAAIGRVGPTFLMMVSTWDANSTNPIWASGATSVLQGADTSTSGTASDPILTINYTIPPLTSFTSNVTTGTAPLSIQFNDTSTNTPTSWNWSYTNVSPGNGTQIWWSTTRNATQAFGTGNWSIKLNATNTAGSNITPGTYFVNVSAAIPALIANFSANVTSGAAPLSVGFTDSTTGSPTGWTWFFGDEPYNQTWVQQTANAGWTVRMSFGSVVLSDGSIVTMGGTDNSKWYNDT